MLFVLFSLFGLEGQADSIKWDGTAVFHLNDKL